MKLWVAGVVLVGLKVRVHLLVLTSLARQALGIVRLLTPRNAVLMEIGHAGVKLELLTVLEEVFNAVVEIVDHLSVRAVVLGGQVLIRICKNLRVILGSVLQRIAEFV